MFAMTYPNIGEILAWPGKFEFGEGEAGEAVQGRRMADVAREEGVKVFLW